MVDGGGVAGGDTRGLVDPDEMFRHVDFGRATAGDALAGVVAWFWWVSWDLPPGRQHDQEVLNHPAGNLSIGTIDDDSRILDPAGGRLYGVMHDLSSRRLSGAGWTIAARTAVGGLGVLLDRPAREIADRCVALDAVAGLDPGLVAQVVDTATLPGRVDVLRSAMTEAIETRPPGLLAEAREVVAIARLAEQDRTICRVEQLAAAGSVSVRTLHRLFDRHVGASPAFVIRRWRIIEAADAAAHAGRDGDGFPGWATVAAELGYADQSHLARDFRRHLGVTPTTYVERNRVS